MNTLLSIIGAILVLVLGTLFSVPHFIDWNQYRGVIEEEASRAVGRDVRIGSKVHVRLLPSPSIRLEDVRIADTTALTGEPIFRTAEVSAKLAISPLLTGSVEVSEIELIRPVVRLIVDDNGGGNWQSLTSAAPGLSYLPSNISLKTVLVSDGRLIVYGEAGRRERLSITSIAGDVSTPMPAGPHRFKGTVVAAGRTHDVRGQLTEPDEQGSRRVSVTSKSDAGGALRFEGRASTSGALPTLRGETTASVPFATTGDRDAAQSVEIKTDLVADTRGADLSNIQIAFESGGRPQNLTGSGRIRWQDDTDLTIAVGAQWLDLDQIAAFKPGTGDTPLAALGRTFGRLPDWARVGGGRRTIRVALSQAALGGDSIGSVTAVLSGAGAATRIDEFRATLPGGGRIEAAGEIADAGTAASRFSGMAMIKASSAARLVTWASGGRIAAEPHHDGPLDVNGTVVLAPSSVSISKLSGQAGTSVFEGSVDYAWGEKPEAKVVLSGPALDVRAFDGAVKEESLLSIFDRIADHASSQGRSAVSLSLTTGELTTSRRNYRNVAAIFSLAGGILDIRRLDATTDDGASLAIEGRLTRTPAVVRSSAAASTPFPLAGILRGAVSVPHTGALKSVVELSGLPPVWATNAGQIGAAFPLSLAGTAEFASSGPKPALRIDAEGMTGDVKTRIDGAIEVLGASWATKPVDLTLSLAGADDRAIDRLVAETSRALWATEFRRRGAAAESAGDTIAGTMRLRAAGIPRETLSVMLSHESAGGTVTFDGRANAVDTNPKLTGTLSVAATNGATALSVVPMLPVEILAGTPVSGRAIAALESGELRLDDIALTAGSINARGALQFKRTEIPRAALSATSPSTWPAQAAVAVEGTLALSSLDLRRMIELTTDTGRGADAAGSGISVTMGRGGVWPERPFDFSLVDAQQGRINLLADKLVLPDGIEAEKASATLELARGRLELSNLEATGLGGKWTVSARLEKQAGGAALSANLRLDQGDLGRLGGTGPVAGQGSLSGVGVTPAALATALTGVGWIDVGPATKASGLSARTLRQVVERALGATPDQLGQVLQSGLSEAAAQDLPLGARKIGFEVSNGLARLKPVALESPEGRVLIGGRLDLASLVTASDWQTDAKMPPPPSLTIPLPQGLPPLPPLPQKTTAQLPPVIISTSEALATLGKPNAKRARQVNASDLERELAVRKVERDLEALERMRQIDEELQKLRARERAEDVARREAEARAQADAAATAAAQLPPPAPQPVGEPVTAPITPPAPTEVTTRPAQKSSGAGQPKAATGIRPFSDEERRRIFNSGGGG